MNPYEKARLEALSESKLESEIANLLGEGKTSEAYRVFEELPLDSQLGISMAPGIGDALATFEIGEFKDRADKRFEQGDTLGGIGNIALSGLSGLSLLPLVGAVPGAIGDVASKLGRNFRVPEGETGGGPSSADYSLPEPVPLAQNRELVFDYPGTRPSVYTNTGDPDEIIEGLASPNRLALALFDQDEAYEPFRLIKRLKQKTGADKARELEKLDVIMPDGKLTEDFSFYAKNINEGNENAGKITPRQLEDYMRGMMNSPNEKTGEFSVQTQRVGQRGDSGFEDYATLDSEIQRVYKLDDIKIPKTGEDGAHYLGFGKNVLGFDGVQIAQDGSKIVKNIARVQSDYEEAIRDLASQKKVQGEKGNPFVKKALIPEDIDIEGIVEKIKPDLEKAKKLTARVNNLRNEAKTKVLFDEDGKVRTNLGLKDRVTFEKDDLLRPDDFNEAEKRLVFTLQDIQNSLKQSVYSKTGDSSVFDTRFPIKGSFEVTENLSPGLKEAIDRVKFYAKGDRDVALGPVVESFNVGRLRFAQNQFDPTFEIRAAPTVDADLPKEIGYMFDNYNEAAKRFNELDLPKKDMYSTKTSTKSYILPIRSNINESARLGHDEIRITPERIFEREGGSSSPYIRSYYENIAKEAEKVAKELDLNPKEIVKRGKTLRAFKFQRPGNDLRKFFDIDIDSYDIFYKNGERYDKDTLDRINFDLQDIRLQKDALGDKFDMSELNSDTQKRIADAIGNIKENAIGMSDIDSIDDLGLVKIPLYRRYGDSLEQIRFPDGKPYYMRGNQQIFRQGDITIDTKKIKSALEAGKKITLMSEGGLAELQKRIDNL
jgi:hypothetical protein